MLSVHRYLTLVLFTGFQAGILTMITIGISSKSSFAHSRFVGPKQRPLYLKIIKYVSLFLGECLGVWFFWDGFGMGMVASNNESSWVMTYVYFSLWIAVPVVTASYFLPLIGGFVLIGNAFWSFYLLNQIWLNPISLGEKDQIFSVKNNLYDLWLTQKSVSGPLLLLGIVFLLIGLTDWIKFGVSKRTPG